MWENDAGLEGAKTFVSEPRRLTFLLRDGHQYSTELLAQSLHGDMSTRSSILSDDVLRMIFEQLELPPPASSTLRAPLLPVESRRTLARSACVCKAFYGHAVRVLWRHLDDLIPLLQLLSSFAKVGERTRHGGYAYDTYVSDMRSITHPIHIRCSS